MDMYNYMMPLAFALALRDNDTAMDKFTNLTEAQKEEMINRAKDTKSDDEVAIILNELSMHNGMY